MLRREGDEGRGMGDGKEEKKGKGGGERRKEASVLQS